MDFYKEEMTNSNSDLTLVSSLTKMVNFLKENQTQIKSSLSPFSSRIDFSLMEVNGKIVLSLFYFYLVLFIKPINAMILLIWVAQNQKEKVL